MDECLRIGKPCKFEGLAKTWPGFEQWNYDSVGSAEGEGRPYYKMEMTIGGDTIVDVYIETDPDAYMESAPLNSFKEEKRNKMRYRDFLEKSGSSLTSIEIVLRDESEALQEALKPLIAEPEFFSEVCEPAGVVLLQASSGFHLSPKYEHHEQFLCAIDGLMQVKLIPPVFRQEVYAGKDRTIIDPTDKDPKDKGQGPTTPKERTPPNESPVNFFEPDYAQYPLFNEVERKYTVILHEGDCVFIPAFYFHQYSARAPNVPIRENRKPEATGVILKYKAHSQLLSGFFQAIEKKVLT